VHWHGLRLDNASDGTHETQAPIPIGGRFSCRVAFPDPGIYWYHPHIREDYAHEMGLYGNVIVEPADPDYWIDPVCQMAVDPEHAAGRLVYADNAYFFCTLSCAGDFARQPEPFVRSP
jgi:FtsP/CotA-like multicopper oxidase with cupredoxin domain